MHRDYDIDHEVIDERKWLHFVTGADYAHSFLTSFVTALMTSRPGPTRWVEFQARCASGTAYFPQGDEQLTVITGAAMPNRRGR